MQSELSVEIDRRIDEVFEYTLKNVSDWSITGVEVEYTREDLQESELANLNQKCEALPNSDS